MGPELRGITEKLKKKLGKYESNSPFPAFQFVAAVWCHLKAEVCLIKLFVDWLLGRREGINVNDTYYEFLDRVAIHSFVVSDSCCSILEESRNQIYPVIRKNRRNMESGMCSICRTMSRISVLIAVIMASLVFQQSKWFLNACRRQFFYRNNRFGGWRDFFCFDFSETPAKRNQLAKRQRSRSRWRCFTAFRSLDREKPAHHKN